MTTRLLTALILALAVGFAAAVSPYASRSPDGLEKVAQRQGFADRERPRAVQGHAPAPGYAVPGIADPRLATGAAGFAGTLTVFGLSVVVVKVVRRRGRTALP